MAGAITMGKKIIVSTTRRDDRASRLRRDLMYKLGVDVKGALNQREFSHQLHAARRDRRSMLGGVPLTHVPLNDIAELSSTEAEANGFALRLQWLISRLRTPQEHESSGSLSCAGSVSSNSTANSDSTRRRRKLAFDEKVTVCPIPRREEYSKRIKNQLWIPKDEMLRNVQRNALEFAAEGWDWKSSIEDDEMYRCVQSNELIHPIHIKCRQHQQEEEQQQQHQTLVE